MLRTLSLMLIMTALPVLTPAQVRVADERNDAPGLQVVGFHWTKHRPMKVSLDTGLPSAEGRAIERMDDFRLDRRIAARRMAGKGTVYSEEQRQRRQRQLPEPIPSTSSRPSDPDWSGYSYTIEVLNASGKKVEALEWDYVFADPQTGKELLRRSFASKVDIKPGKRKKARIYTTAWPAGVVSATSAVGGGERVEIKRVFYSDGEPWEK